MHRVSAVAVAAALAAFSVSVAARAQAPAVTAFEGARLIVGDGRTIENATLVVEGSRIAQAEAASASRAAQPM